MKHKNYRCKCGCPVKIKTGDLIEGKRIFCKFCKKEVPEKERIKRTKVAILKELKK